MTMTQERPVDLVFKGRVQAIETKTCVECRKPATEFKDALSKTEFGISGLCQACQDAFYDAPPVAEEPDTEEEDEDEDEDIGDETEDDLEDDDEDDDWLDDDDEDEDGSDDDDE